MTVAARVRELHRLRCLPDAGDVRAFVADLLDTTDPDEIARGVEAYHVEIQRITDDYAGRMEDARG